MGKAKHPVFDGLKAENSELKKQLAECKEVLHGLIYSPEPGFYNRARELLGKDGG